MSTEVNDPREIDQKSPAEPLPASQEGEAATPQPEPLRSVHTTSFPQILQNRGVSVLVTTYQAGRLVVLRADAGVLNTHFAAFPSRWAWPFAAIAGDRAGHGDCEYHNLPAVAAKAKPEGKHDACFLPRSAYATGDIQIHEMAWVGNELWFVNTAFSCLCTRSDGYSFRPRWRPPFVSHLVPEDRCHLNGLGLVDGQVRYVTRPGRNEHAAGGWRANKRDGGILIDVPANQIIARGLSMPHSPRWYDGRLWLLESGAGRIGTIDPASGRYQMLAELPGYTRGLSFHGPLAFVGLSQVRESAVFSGIPLVERVQDRSCGVWVVNIHTGETVAFVKFEDAVQEIFAVEVLPTMQYPDVITDDKELLARSFVLPDDALADVPESLRART